MIGEVPALDVEALYRDYHARAYAYALHHLGNVSDAEDVVGRVFLSVHEKKDTYDPRRGAPSTWLYAITQNEVRGVLRRRAGMRTEADFQDWESLPAPDTAPEETLLTRERVDELAAVLKELPQRERDILLLRFYSGLPSKEVAVRMGLSDANTRYLQSKALATLRKKLKLSC